MARASRRAGTDSQCDALIDIDSRGRIISELAVLHILGDAGFHVVLRRSRQHRHTRAFARGVGQNLNVLVHTSELEDADRNQQNDWKNDRRLEQRLPGLAAEACIPRPFCDR